MKNVAIIGLGKISAPHIVGLQNNSDKYNIVAMCDTNETLRVTANDLNVPFYADYKEAVKLDNVNLVVILTPPSTHYEIAKEALINKKHVVIEKPGVLELNHLYELIEVAKQNDVTVDVLYHWQYGSEVLAIKDKLNTYGKLFKIEVNAYDPYTLTDRQTIRSDALSLGGAWNDSGINILSMLVRFLDITKLKLQNEYIEYDPTTNLPIYVKKKYTYDNIEVLMNIDWRENKNHKFSNFFYEEGTLFVHHTAQDIWFNANRVFNFDQAPRLNTHYTNLFKHLELSFDNINNTVELHKLLLNK